MAMDQARDAGFTPVIPPALVKPAGHGGHRLPRPGRRRRLPHRGGGPLPRRHLRGAARGVPLRRDPRRPTSLPLRYAAFSPCFRKEAGSTARTPAGIIRVHWFDKVEMFSYTTVEESYAEHQRLLGWEKELLDKLELAFRVIDVAAGDLGLSALAQVRLRGVDPDPGQVPRADLDLELHRLPGPPPRHPRPVRRRAGTEPPVATLNGTLCAMTRTIVAILETHQQADGSVRVPEALRPYLRAARSWSRSPADATRPRAERLAAAARRARHRRHAARLGRGRRHETVEEVIAGGRTTPSTAPWTPAPTSCWPRGRSPHGMTRDRGPARPATTVPASRCGSWRPTAR